MRKFGLADALGIVTALVAIVWLPGAADPLVYVKLLVLAAGGLALAPAVISRWTVIGRPPWLVLIPAVSAVLLFLWAIVSTVGSGAPIWNSLYGWFGRGDGLLAIAGSVVLLAGAASLAPREVARTVTWLLGGATFVAVVGLLQVFGVDIPQGSGGQVTGTMGNTNFAAGYFAIVGVLALGRALTSARTWHRVWGGLLFLILSLLAWRTDSIQGPVALASGVIALGVAYALLYRGRFRTLGLIAAAATVVIGLVAVAISFFGSGPLARIWSERTFGIRQQYWQSGLNIMEGLPIFGTGPDGFARYVAEFRPESYVETVGPALRVSAAHNIALQFGATLGWLALVLWILAFFGAGVALLVRIFRFPAASAGLTASVAGALTAYLVQGMVSIDMLPLLATGWLVTGAALAMAREPIATSSPELPEGVRASRPKPSGRSRQAVKLDAPSTPIWVPVTGSVLALGAALLVGTQIGLVNGIQSIRSQEQAVDFVTDARTPCPLRVQVAQQVIEQLPAEVSVPATLDATDRDPRCPSMINFASDVTLQQQQLESANNYTSFGVEIDPLLDLAWALRARYFLAIGDVAAAEAAADEARRVQSLYAGDPTLVDSLFQEIEAAK